MNNTVVFIIIFLISQNTMAQTGSRLIGSAAVTQIEGSSGSGLLPWATISGYADAAQSDFTLSYSSLDTKDYRFSMKSLSWGWNNRLELSVAKQQLDLQTLGPAIGMPDAQLKQTVIGAKLRLFGHLIYSKYPQVSLGLQYKTNNEFLVPSLVGAAKKQGVDVYLSATKLFLSKPFGFNGFATFNLRATKANEIGLLGFGGDINNDYRILVENSFGVFVKKNVALGFDFRQKKSNLGFAKESHWRDVFVSWLPNKHLSLTLAYVDLGGVATLKNQQGLYFSISGVF